ncbi:CPCC family cysteine-rich protein [Streptomyces syringium]|uniref:CPCC family cysteine-rich protein n=1 Tax=Streptomyces syringium TaxID=76729 RepID=UPI0036F15F97
MTGLIPLSRFLWMIRESGTIPAMAPEEQPVVPSIDTIDTTNGLFACHCCFQLTLEERANFEICPECGWEDDGQDDADAHFVRGGPNGRLSLEQAQLDYCGTRRKVGHGRGFRPLWSKVPFAPRGGGNYGS